MAKQDNGIAGGYRGSVGNITGYRWRGIWCLRAKAQQVRNPRTERQQGHRAAFRERVRLASRFGRVAYKGFHKVVEQAGMTEQNYFIKCNRHAFSEVDGGLAVDWARLCVSEGPVAPVGFGCAEVESETEVLRVDFEKNPMHMRASSDDDVYLFVYCPAGGSGMLSKPVARRAGTISLCLPDEWAGCEVIVYGFVCDYMGRCSMSSYIEQRQTEGADGGEGNAAVADGAEAVDGTQPLATEAPASMIDTSFIEPPSPLPPAGGL